MPDRLTAQDTSFLYVEQPAVPMHVGTVTIFSVPDEGFEIDRLTSLIAERLAQVPRFRQRIRSVPASLAHPVWVDDAGFDLDYHVRRAALPRPGSMEQLEELVARVQSRPLDRHRPLWELYVVEGLAPDNTGSTGDAAPRVALITKTHQALVDGISAVDLAHVILDTEPNVPPSKPPPWRPEPEPGWPELVIDAVAGMIRSPERLGEAIRRGVADLRRTAARTSMPAVGRAVARTATDTAAWLAGPAAPASPLNVAIGAQRRFATVRTDLEPYRRVRLVDRAASHTVNDVVLTVIAGALRTWLLSRGEAVDRSTFLRALVPVSVQAEAAQSGVASYFVDLPVGEPDPLVRLHQVGYRMKAHNVSRQRIGADALSGLTGFAPPTLHALGARAAGNLSRRSHNLVITNVPGPREPRYAAGAKLLESYPIVPIAPGRALAIGVTSYLGHVCYGLTADRDALPDLDVLSQCIDEALSELVAAGDRAGTGRR